MAIIKLCSDIEKVEQIHSWKYFPKKNSGYNNEYLLRYFHLKHLI